MLYGKLDVWCMSDISTGVVETELSTWAITRPCLRQERKIKSTKKTLYYIYNS